MKRSALFLVVTCALFGAFSAAGASAATYTVTSTADTPDQGDDGVCNTAGNVCTLRAAIQQVNADADPSATINFGIGITGQTITAANPPAVTSPVTIQGCANPLTATAPCMQVDSTGTNGLIFNAMATVSGLALRAGPGGPNSLIWLTNGDGSAISGNWVGMGLNGVANDGYTATGILISDGADGATIGGTTASARNLINGANEGLFVDGVDGTSVKGNYFSNNAAGDGGTQNGNSVLRNRTNISVGTADSDVADNTLIGASGAFEGGACDGACNLISNALGYQDGGDWVKGSAIDLTGSGPAGSVTVQGNYMGTDVTGANALANHGRSTITMVGGTGDIVIGGPNATDGNVLASQSLGNTWRGLYQDGASNISFQHNLVGMNAAGTTARAFDIDAVVIRGTVGKTAAVRDNRIVGSSSSAVQGNGTGPIVAGNTVNIGLSSNAGGIRLSATNGSVTNNVVGGTLNTPAIAVEYSNGNTITGNTLGSNAAKTVSAPVYAGISIIGNSANNTIGGPLASDGNYIANTTHDAVVIPSTGIGNNFISSTGTNIGEQFIDVGGDSGTPSTDVDGDGPGNTSGANGGVPLPTISSATSTSATGTTSLPAVGVRLYETTTSTGQPQSIRAALGTTTSSGTAWTLTIPPISDDNYVTALQKYPAGGGTGELTDVFDVATDNDQPDTILDSEPAGPIVLGGQAQFGFLSEVNATFKCSVDNSTPVTCASPFTTAALPIGTHTFDVFATDINGNDDPTPAHATFSIVAAPVNPPGGGGAIVAPVISSAKLKGKATIKKGATLTVAVDKASTLSVKLTQKTKKGKKTKTKTKTVSLGALTAGTNTKKLSLKGFKAGKISAVLSAASQGVASSKTLSIKAKKK